MLKKGIHPVVLGKTAANLVSIRKRVDVRGNVARSARQQNVTLTPSATSDTNGCAPLTAELVI